jgi:hypothetical protein
MFYTEIIGPGQITIRANLGERSGRFLAVNFKLFHESGNSDAAAIQVLRWGIGQANAITSSFFQ